MGKRSRNRASNLPMPMNIKQDPDAVKKKYCPASMVRYDNTNTGYGSVWVCRICEVVIISEKGVKDHLLRCNLKGLRKKTEPEIEDYCPIYECDVCNQIFKRQIILKKHKQAHDKPKEVYYQLVPRKKKRCSKKKQMVNKMLSPLKLKLEIKKEKFKILRCNLKGLRKKTEPEIEDYCPIYECDVCNKIFKRQVILEKHKQDHDKPKEVYYQLVPRKKKRCSKKKQMVNKMLSPLKLKLEIKKEKFY